MKLKKGDEIIVTRGKDLGKKGKIEKSLPAKGKVLVTGLNMFKRHLKSRGQGKPGGIVDIIRPISIANVALICSHCGQRTRIGYRLAKEGKERICRKCKEKV